VIKCHYCDKEAQDGDNFCRYCGSDLSVKEQYQIADVAGSDLPIANENKPALSIWAIAAFASFFTTSVWTFSKILFEPYLIQDPIGTIINAIPTFICWWLIYTFILWALTKSPRWILALLLLGVAIFCVLMYFSLMRAK
jgi:hypothetical protein